MQWEIIVIENGLEAILINKSLNSTTTIQKSMRVCKNDDIEIDKSGIL